jgi:hypothetical protein
VARFIIDVLSDLGRAVRVPMSELVRHAAARDKTLTPVIFFTPEAVAEITDDQGGSGGTGSGRGTPARRLSSSTRAS